MTVGWISTTAALIVAAILTWSAAAKLRSPEQTLQSFSDLGLPRLSARLVPLVEAAVAALLVVDAGWGGTFAFALMASFTTTLVLIVRSGRKISCGCFGGADSDPVTWLHVGRNLVILGLCAAAASSQ